MMEFLGRFFDGVIALEAVPLGFLIAFVGGVAAMIGLVTTPMAHYGDYQPIVVTWVGIALFVLGVALAGWGVFR